MSFRRREPRGDLLVIGGGAAGLAAAREGVRRGLRCVLAAQGPLGGDCTFAGCIPSKTLIEAAAQGLRFSEAMARMRSVVAEIAASEDADTLRGEGVEVVEDRAVFCGPHTVSVGGGLYRPKAVVIATGSRPAVPPLAGLEQVGYLTNETVFELDALPASLAILGGGPIGCELAQAFARFGARVDLIEATERLLPQEEPEASAAIARALSAEGVRLHLGARAQSAKLSGGGSALSIRLSNSAALEAEAVLVAVGRRPFTDGMGLEAAGVALDTRGFVRVDRHLATSAPGVFAAGDVTGVMNFTHAADEMGRIAAHNAASSRRSLRHWAFDPNPIPWVTFCDPEVARVGMTEAQAAEVGALVAYLPLAEVDRAKTAARTDGFVKLLAGPRPLLRGLGGGRLLGATVVAPRAGEMIHEVALAMRTNMFAGRLAQTVHAYPTWSLALRQAAAQLFVETGGRRAHPAARPSSELPAATHDLNSSG